MAKNFHVHNYLGIKLRKGGDGILLGSHMHGNKQPVILYLSTTCSRSEPNAGLAQVKYITNKKMSSPMPMYYDNQC